MSIEREALRVLVRLEDVEPLVPGGGVIQNGERVTVTHGVFAGLTGQIVNNPFAGESPFTVIVEEEV